MGCFLMSSAQPHHRRFLSVPFGFKMIHRWLRNYRRADSTLKQPAGYDRCVLMGDKTTKEVRCLVSPHLLSSNMDVVIHYIHNSLLL